MAHRYVGIYPRCLNITMEQSSKDSVTHQDLRIRRYIDNPTGTAGGGPTYRYRTETYDKKDDTQYDRIRDHIVYYCHPDTMLPDSCIYGVVYSQAQRYAKRNSTLEDWCPQLPPSSWLLRHPQRIWRSAERADQPGSNRNHGDCRRVWGCFGPSRAQSRALALLGPT